MSLTYKPIMNYILVKQRERIVRREAIIKEVLTSNGISIERNPETLARMVKIKRDIRNPEYEEIWYGKKMLWRGVV